MKIIKFYILKLKYQRLLCYIPLKPTPLPTTSTKQPRKGKTLKLS